MPNDISRLEALRQGIKHSLDEGYVTIRVADLKWMLDQVEGRQSAPITDDSPTGDHDDRDQE